MSTVKEQRGGSKKKFLSGSLGRSSRLAARGRAAERKSVASWIMSIFRFRMLFACWLKMRPLRSFLVIHQTSCHNAVQSFRMCFSVMCLVSVTQEIRDWPRRGRKHGGRWAIGRISHPVVLPLWWIFLWVNICWDCNVYFSYESRCILCTPFKLDE